MVRQYEGRRDQQTVVFSVPVAKGQLVAAAVGGLEGLEPINSLFPARDHLITTLNIPQPYPLDNEQIDDNNRAASTVDIE